MSNRRLLSFSFTCLFAFPAVAAPKPERVRLSMGPKAWLSATLTGVDQQHADQHPRITILLKKAGQAEKNLVLDLTAERYPQLSNVIRGSFFWALEASSVKLGAKKVARIGLYGRTGEDLMVMDEIAVLLDTDQEPKVIWVGLGDREENRFDVCMISTRASFRLTKDGQLERRARSVRHVEKVDDDEGMAAYAKGCIAPKPRVDRFPLVGDQPGPADAQSPAAPARR